MRRWVIAVSALVLMLAACGAAKDKPDPEPTKSAGGEACCAIEPKAKCEAQMSGAGVTRKEMDALHAPARCPSTVMSEARLREIGEIVDRIPDCRSAFPKQLVVGQLEAGECHETYMINGVPSSMISATETSACQAGLRKRGLTDNEMWTMMQEPKDICPRYGVKEKRIREILGFWASAGCTAHTAGELSVAMDRGECKPED